MVRSLQARVFVGREPELLVLESSFDSAASGIGGVVLVAGEPGVGKTALCRQLEERLKEKDARVLLGRCFEDDSPSPPYRPFVEVLNSYIAQRRADELRDELGEKAPFVARILPSLTKLLSIDHPASGDSEEDRWHLFQSVSELLKDASASGPIAIVIEDLHAADSGTIQLLVHLGRTVADSKLLLVGTYRDVEIDDSHPLSHALAELQRTSEVRRVQLRGLDVSEVHHLLESVKGSSVSRAQALFVHRHTDGNPLFVLEVLRFLQEEGHLTSPADENLYASRLPPEKVLPVGLREAVAKRMSLLDERTKQVLSPAAVIGRDFDLQVLSQLIDLSDSDLLAALEEAVEHGVLDQLQEVGSLRFRFSHAVIRQILYAGIFAPRRANWHGQVGTVLEGAYSDRREENAAELAQHFAMSSDQKDLAKAAAYGELAARQAMNVFAYAESESHLQRCLSIQNAIAPEDETRRCDLLLALGDAILPQPSPGRLAVFSAEEAFQIAERLGDSQRATRAAIQALESFSLGFGGEQSMTTRAEWTERAHRYAALGTTERPRADVALAMHAFAESRPRDASVHFRHAIEQVKQLDDAAEFYAVVGRAGSHMRSLRDRALVIDLARRVATLPRDGIRSSDLGVCLFTAGDVLLEVGDRSAAEGVWADLVALAERTSDSTLTYMAVNIPVALALADGRLEEGVAEAQRVNVPANQASFFITARMASIITALLNLGRESDLPTILPPAMAPVVLGSEGTSQLLTGGAFRWARSIRAVLVARAGDVDKWHEILGEFSGIELDDDETHWLYLRNFLEGATLIADQPTAAVLSRRLGPLADQLASDGVSIGRLLAEADILLGKPTAAREHFESGLAIAKKAAMRPEIALVRLGLAELFVDYFPTERTSAQEHLKFAVEELRTMKMRPALDRALRLEEKEKGSQTAPVHPDHLTTREVQILTLVAHGRSNREIAQQLSLSIRTIERHLTNAYLKIGAHNKAQATTYAVSRGLIQP